MRWRPDAGAPARAPGDDWPGFLEACRGRVLEMGVDVCPDARLRVATVADDLLGRAGMTGVVREAMLREVVAELAGYGVLEGLMARDDVTEVMVNGTEPIWIETDGRLERTPLRFSSRETLRLVVERMLVASGRRVDEGSPMVDARLADGSRLNVVLPPVAPEILVTVRRFRATGMGMDQLVDAGMLTARTAAFLHAAVMGRASILVSGATGSGKTTFVGALAGLIPEGERIVVVEDVTELAIDHPHVASAQCRPAGADGVVEIGLRDLVRNSLRMRPDRIIVGEVRGAEAVEMVQAMNTGHAGSMTTLHANSSEDSLIRLETLLALGFPALGSDVTQRWIASAIDLIAHCERGRDGHRRLAEIAAVHVGDAGLAATTIFRLAQDGASVVSTGAIPYGCLQKMAAHGVVFPPHLLGEASAA